MLIILENISFDWVSDWLHNFLYPRTSKTREPNAHLHWMSDQGLISSYPLILSHWLVSRDPTFAQKSTRQPVFGLIVQILESLRQGHHLAK